MKLTRAEQQRLNRAAADTLRELLFNYAPNDGWSYDYVVSDDDQTDEWRGDWWPDAQPEDTAIVQHPDYH